MDDARKYYDDTKTHQDINLFIVNAVSESTYIDFKNPIQWKGALSTAERKKAKDELRPVISKIASAFAHQKGGTVIWGIEAKKTPTGDFAQKPCPIKSLRAFLSFLDELSVDAISPRLPLEHDIIYIDNDPKSDEGFVKTYIPCGSELYRAYYAEYDYYIRYGGHSMPVTTREDMRAILSSNMEPELELTGRVAGGQKSGGRTTQVNVSIFLRNKGNGVAKYPSFRINYKSMQASFTVWQGRTTTFGDFIDSTNLDYKKQFISYGLVIHPGQAVLVGQVSFSAEKAPEITYECFAEGMKPTHGSFAPELEN